MLRSSDNKNWNEYTKGSEPLTLNAGEYFFWFKLDGDNNNKGFEATKFDVNVGKAKLDEIGNYFPSAIDQGYIKRKINSTVIELFNAPTSYNDDISLEWRYRDENNKDNENGFQVFDSVNSNTWPKQTNIIVNDQGQHIDENDNPIDLEKALVAFESLKMYMLM